MCSHSLMVSRDLEWIRLFDKNLNFKTVVTDVPICMERVIWLNNPRIKWKKIIFPHAVINSPGLAMALLGRRRGGAKRKEKEKTEPVTFWSMWRIFKRLLLYTKAIHLHKRYYSRIASLTHYLSVPQCLATLSQITRMMQHIVRACERNIETYNLPSICKFLCYSLGALVKEKNHFVR